jgi:plastocyanin
MRSSLIQGFSGFLLCCCCVAANALSVLVIDPAGRRISNVVVVVTAVGSQSPRVDSADGAHAQMDQRNREFVPHVLVIEAGTWVDFPNSDTVSHQVYSFSPAKPFQLPLYKGSAHPPVLFDHPGLVTLGCNIHDNMLGYI